MQEDRKIILFSNTDWYLYNFRLSLANALKQNGYDVILVAPAGSYQKRLVNLGFRFVPLNFPIWSANPISELQTIIRIANIYRKEKPLLVHHFTLKCVLYGSFAAKINRNIKVVNSVTGISHILRDPGMRAKIFSPLIKALYRFVLSSNESRVIFQNTEDRDYFVKNNLVKEYLTKIIRGSGVNCEIFKPTNSLNRKKNKRVKILFASRMLKEKGIYELIEAAKILKKKGTKAEFLFAGDIYPDNPSSLTQEDVARIKSEGIVEYLGHVEDMKQLLNKCDIVVLPSYSEGTPRILIEAAAMEKPIVATDIAGHRGLIQHNINGLLVPTKNVKALVEALIKLIENEELRTTMGKEGREIVLKEFDEKIVIEKTLAVYNELLHLN